ncbi:xanthine dehydrogenase family protein molybdopterin-binding subunit [Sinorhizobium meliloti]|uniref:xanthine dehydrogenase family protein molybdopterin-binding subunit n=1 Tax=Rhizobium meliloti TaxID=382 RepID=UPI000FD3D34A|nr:molybdopterin cofactor-binding domain-containing protein [Sinorhizobium meliloti]RVI16289.1 xanthine dehydrogenase family protein molybdopterin-binding subunit [Sinorhizobium meliloti]RVN86843.1 xanthine dehydrogenase family protein molybdopterin-binding subunit [Sinorhizobium meliloti]RVO11899.1 xanthine dehydrogenase family protein molybdopterin-binding subunit [Sinorhizobium meliloti]
MAVHDKLTLPLSRRHFLIGASLTGAGLVIGLQPSPSSAAAEAFEPNAFIRIPAEGKVVFVMPSVEMGQGIYTSVAMLLAEELEVSLDQVELEHAPADPTRYANPLLGDQITGGSIAIRAVYEPMRKAGAAARIMLVNAAARGWGVAPETCSAEAGHVVHATSGRRAAYGSLIQAAAAEAVPQEMPLKPASSFKLIGQSVRRLDSPEKVNGTAKFGIDARPQGVSYAAIAICPHFGGKLGAVETGPAMAVKGVKQVARIEDAVAVVADNTGAARKGLAALSIEWEPGPNGTLSLVDLEKRAEEAIDGNALPHINEGNVAKAEAEHGPALEFVYRLPILTHSAMEPMNCTLHVRSDGCDVWVGTQVMGRARQAVADVTGLPLEKVIVHNHLLGGGFGRRLDVDGIILAAKIAKQVEGPVKVTWSREEDIRHDCYRYLNYSKVTATLGADGMPVSWRHRVIGPAVMARWLPAFTRDGIDLDIMAGAETPYAITNKYTDFVRHEAPEGMLTGNWRGVGATRNLPAIEGGIDELAHAAGVDPLEYRRRLLQHKPRLLAALDLAAEKAGWATALPPGKGRGIALSEDFGSFAAMISEMSVGDDGSLRTERIICAVDCGQVINPDTVEAQIQSGIIYGLSAALYGRITVQNGAVVEGNFDDSPVLRINETPKIEVHIVPSSEAPGGIGEVGTPGVAPSLLNAIFVATGKRLRSLPIDHNELRRA